MRFFITSFSVILSPSETILISRNLFNMVNNIHDLDQRYILEPELLNPL